MKMKTRLLILQAAAAALVFMPTFSADVRGACTAGQEPFNLPFAEGETGPLDVTECGVSCDGSCYLSVDLALKQCVTSGSSESPTGCAPAVQMGLARKGTCISGGQGPAYACGCGNLGVSLQLVALHTAETCTP